MEIKTSGQLRRFLAKALQEVHDGSIDDIRAQRIVKIAAQINESFYSEVKVNQLRAEAGDQIVALGRLSIGDPEEA